MAQLSGFALRHSSADLTESAPLNSYLPGPHSDIPELPSPKLACCCGQSCAFSKHCHSALSGMQNDVLTAARAGQALLLRHEAYVVDSERERRELADVIEQLQTEKRTVEAMNANLMEENQLLKTQLEELNQSVADSDVHIKSLDATLRSTRQELNRLSGLKSRTAQLEMQLSAMECEIAQTQQVAIGAQEQEKQAVQRWKSAERSLQALQGEVEGIEKRFKEERELHGEVVARLQRKQLVDAELKVVAEDLPTCDSRRQSRTTHNSNVIAHFVKDLLQDNTNLQASMVELRDMLLASNEENGRLKEELIMHQPALAENEHNPLTASLADDLHLESSRPDVRETHIDQYCSMENMTRNSSCQPSQQGCGDDTTELPSAALSTPGPVWTSHNHRHLTSSASTVVSQTSITIASKTKSTWEISNARPFILSTPHLAVRSSIAYDPAVSDSGIEVSPPTHPRSDGPTTPTPAPGRRGEFSRRLAPISRKAPTSLLKPAAGKCEADARCSTAEGVKGSGVVARLDLAAAQAISNPQTVAGYASGVHENTNTTTDRCHPLGCSSSHESLLSISGMDIHTVRRRPSRPIITGSGLLPRTTSQTSSVSAAPISDKPVMGAMATAARPSIIRHRYDSSSYNRSLLQGNSRSQTAERSTSFLSGQSKDTLRRKLGDWVWGKWGSGSTSSREDLPVKAAQSEKSKDRLGKAHGGPKLESNSSPQEIVKVVATNLDETLLRESLLE